MENSTVFSFSQTFFQDECLIINYNKSIKYRPQLIFEKECVLYVKGVNCNNFYKEYDLFGNKITPCGNRWCKAIGSPGTRNGVWLRVRIPSSAFSQKPKGGLMYE